MKIRMTAVGALAAMAGAALAQTAQLTIVDPLVGGTGLQQGWAVSEDGQTLVGNGMADPSGSGQPDFFGFRAQNGEPQIVPEILSRDIFGASGDTNVIVGMAFKERPNDPGEWDLTGWYWTPTHGVVDLFSQYVNEGSVAWDASEDGTTIVGMTNFFIDFGGGGGHYSDAAAWDVASGELTVLPQAPLSDRNEVLDVNANATLAAGYGQTFEGDRFAALWDLTENSATSLADPPGVLNSYLASAISNNGRYVAGFALTENGGFGNYREDAVLWDLQGGTVQVLGETPSGFLGAIPSFVSDDGQMVIGTFDRSGFFDFPSGTPFIWTPATGIVTLEDYLLDQHGLDVGVWDLQTGMDASSDGDSTTVVGTASDTRSGELRAYSVTFGGCAADLDGDGDADVNDFFAYLDLFAAGDPGADVNGDGSVDVNDFFGYLDLFAAGC